MPFKSAKVPLILVGLGILFFIFFFILSFISDQMEKRSLFNYAAAFRISAIVFYGCFSISILIIFVKLAVTNNFILALIFIGLFLFSLAFLGANFLLLSRGILNLSRPVFPQKFIKDPDMVQKCTSLAEELISRRNIYFVENRWGESLFGIGLDDGFYVFNSKNIPKDYKFDIPVEIERNNSFRVYLPENIKEHTLGSKIIDQNNYEFCIHASKLIRSTGFSDVKFYSEPNIVRYEIFSGFGLDSPVYFYEYYYCHDTNLPENFKYKIKLNENWYFDSEPNF